MTELPSNIGDRISRAIYEADPENWKRMFTPDGSAPTRAFEAEDGWYIEYSTKRADGGPFDGQFVVLAFKPTGRGARSGKAEEWRRVYFRGFKSRKTAKKRALTIYFQHSPGQLAEGETPQERAKEALPYA